MITLITSSTTDPWFHWFLRIRVLLYLVPRLLIIQLQTVWVVLWHRYVFVIVVSRLQQIFEDTTAATRKDIQYNG